MYTQQAKRRVLYLGFLLLEFTCFLNHKISYLEQEHKATTYGGKKGKNTAHLYIYKLVHM